jgi:hypothetical protein
MAEFMLFIKGGYETWNQLSPEEIQQSIARYRAWSQQLHEQGKLVSAYKLKDDGGRGLPTDGPFAETKETIGGIFQIKVADYNEAMEIARACPILERADGSVEVREIEL